MGIGYVLGRVRWEVVAQHRFVSEATEKEGQKVRLETMSEAVSMKYSNGSPLLSVNSGQIQLKDGIWPEATGISSISSEKTDACLSI